MDIVTEVQQKTKRYKDPVPRIRLVDKDMGHGSQNFPVLENGGNGHE